MNDEGVPRLIWPGDRQRRAETGLIIAQKQRDADIKAMPSRQAGNIMKHINKNNQAMRVGGRVAAYKSGPDAGNAYLFDVILLQREVDAMVAAVPAAKGIIEKGCRTFPLPGSYNYKDQVARSADRMYTEVQAVYYNAPTDVPAVAPRALTARERKLKKMLDG
ncbi:hypothetical protein Q7P37_010799 [Cladosporium fusiforme]